MTPLPARGPLLACVAAHRRGRVQRREGERRARVGSDGRREGGGGASGEARNRALKGSRLMSRTMNLDTFLLDL